MGDRLSPSWYDSHPIPRGDFRRIFQAGIQQLNQQDDPIQTLANNAFRKEKTRRFALGALASTAAVLTTEQIAQKLHLSIGFGKSDLKDSTVILQPNSPEEQETPNSLNYFTSPTGEVIIDPPKFLQPGIEHTLTSKHRVGDSWDTLSQNITNVTEVDTDVTAIEKDVYCTHGRAIHIPLGPINIDFEVDINTWTLRFGRPQLKFGDAWRFIKKHSTQEKPITGHVELKQFRGIGNEAMETMITEVENSGVTTSFYPDNNGLRDRFKKILLKRNDR